MASFLSILLAILLLSILIAVHEAGHFFAARATGIEVREFAIGMGPKLISRVSKKTGIRYSLRAIPLGGFCSFYGEDDIVSDSSDDPRAFHKQKVWKRMLTVLMGPFMNFILAFIVMIGFYLCTPCAVPEPVISEIETNGAAYGTELQVNDVVLSVNGTSLYGRTAQSLSSAISSWKEGDEPLTLLVERRSSDSAEQLSIQLAPRWDEQYNHYRVGVTIDTQQRQELVDGVWKGVSIPRTFPEAVEASWSICSYAGTAIIDSLRSMVQTGEGLLKDTLGPVGVVAVVSKQVREYGAKQFFWMLCLISINLGIMNLLPFPGLDGSRFLFMVIEAVFRKPVPRKAEAIVHTIGMLLLLLLMAVLMFRDVSNLFH